ncbi:MAG: glycosyltransferase family 2 protein [bacterium]|nr:glycosyltransferase family 2 protein [bacterium]
MKKVDIICPLYNAEKYIENLHKSFIMQEKVKVNRIRYVLTESKDNTEEYLKEHSIEYRKIKKNEFSHSLVREKEAMDSDSDIVAFVTQDVVIDDKFWLYKLTKDIGKGNVVATYSRQITKYNNIEKYTREANYPTKSKIVSKDDIPELGLKTFFFSDASSAIDVKVFKRLNGYDGKNLPISEDMYIAHKIITRGYKIKYCAESVVHHSHNFTLKEVYDRYKLTGKFFKENSYLDQYGTNSSGGLLAKYILKRAIQEKNIKVLIRWPFDMAARFIGMKVGKM